mgnify:CR=1 FL=1
MDVEKFIEKGFIKKIEPSKDLVIKEFKEADYDLSKAKKAIIDEDFKWATVKAYYAIFHSAKAILFSLGLQEKTHFIVGEVLKELSKDGKLESNYTDVFNAALAAREDADYHYEYSDKTAKELVTMAVDFVKRMKKMDLM